MTTHEVFTDLSAKFSATAAEYAQAPDSQTALDGVLEARRALAQHIAGIAKLEWDDAWIARFQSILDALAKSGLWDLGVDEQDLAYAGTLGSKSGPTLAAHMILIPAWQWPHAPRIDEVPMAMWGVYASYVFYSPTGFTAIGDAQAYGHQAIRWLEQLCRLAEANRGSAAVRAALLMYLGCGNCIPLYFSEINLRRHYELRGRILTLAHGIGVQPPPLAMPRAGRRLKIGFLNRHFGPQTETYTTLPSFENLDPERFELRLFAIHRTNTPLENYAASKANGITFLGDNIEEQLNILRSEGLDVLVFGTNLTATFHELTRLALYRIAPLQVVNNSSCTTTGLPEIDLYVSGSLAEVDDAQEQYSERLALLPGPAHAFNYTADATEPTCCLTRKDIHVPDDAVLFVSASNYYKVIPEMMECWAELLSLVPNSYLLVHPFNPNWSSEYPAKRFTQLFEQALAKHCVDNKRLIISTIKFRSRSDVGALLGLGDVYLDSYPFGGVNSIIDPLERGIPVVEWEGKAFRSRMGSAILREIGLNECCATDRASYLRICIELANDLSLRGAVREKIERAIPQLPIFFDTLAASDAFGELMIQAFDELIIEGADQFRRARTIIRPREIEAPDKAISTAAYLNDIGMHSEAIEQLYSILARYPAHPSARRALARIIAGTGNHTRAMEYLLAAVQSTDCPAAYWRELSTELRKIGNGDGAKQALETALRLDPEDVETWILLGEIAWESQHVEIQQEACSILQKLAPEDPRVNALIAKVKRTESTI
jgi:hypothetical protein